jgi:hypothetical protein
MGTKTDAIAKYSVALAAAALSSTIWLSKPSPSKLTSGGTDLPRAKTQDRENGDRFIELSEHLMLTEYPAVKVIMVMDNAPYHRSQASTGYDPHLH